MYYYVEVYYHGNPDTNKDSAIRKAMSPVKEEGSGYCFPTKRRELQFIDRDRDQLHDAVLRVRKVPGVRPTAILEYEV